MLTRGREAQARASPDTVLSPLPRCFVRAVFLLLPVDTRLRCCEVSRAWRALLSDMNLWERLVLSTSSGVARVSLPLLRAAAFKAGGQLHALDTTGWMLLEPPQPQQQRNRRLLDVVVPYAKTLTVLRLDMRDLWMAWEVRALLLEAPALRLLELAVVINTDRQVVRSMLRNEPPFQALRVRRLCMVQGLNATEHMVAFCTDLRQHASLERLRLSYNALDTSAAMTAVVDACIALRLHELDLFHCRVVPAVLPELTRLIAAGALRDLRVYNGSVEMFDEAHESTQLFVAAVRASAMTKLAFDDLGDVPENVVEAAAFINARQR